MQCHAPVFTSRKSVVQANMRNFFLAFCVSIGGAQSIRFSSENTRNVADVLENPLELATPHNMHIQSEQVPSMRIQDILKLSNETERKTQYTLLMFDVEGYNRLMDKVMSAESQYRFSQALVKMQTKLPHCDAGSANIPEAQREVALFPGGPFRRNYGFDLTQWITNQMMAIANAAGAANPIVGMMAMMAVTSAIGIISTVLATVIDIVPPMIPPPIWILRPFPCLPMLTGFNCLLSVLYPISIADFMTAHVTDQIMNGVINSFPAKYNSKVGRTSNELYALCAAVYMGMHCASIFPMCWLPTGLMEVQTFPVCFPQCLLVLVACPGFWLDDIRGPCGAVSMPPFCSFSVFINKRLIAPQYTTYEEQHPYPQECPAFDPNYDISPDLYERVAPLPSPIDAAAAEKPISRRPAGKSLIKSIDDFQNIVSPVHRVCDCNAENICSLEDGNCPSKVLSTECREQCSHQIEQQIALSSTPLPERTVVITLKDRPLPELPHVIPVER